MSARPGTLDPAGAARRAPLLVLLAVAVATTVALGRSHAPRVAEPAAPAAAAVLPSAGALSTAWFCPGLPRSFPTQGQTVTLTNLGPAKATAQVTVEPDDGSDPRSRTVAVGPESVVTLDRATLAPAGTAADFLALAGGHHALPAGAVVVEPFSSDVAVATGLETSQQFDTTPCASAAAADWYFAAGTTVRGVSQWLVLQDPFAADARVDVTLRTDTGELTLPSLQGMDVPGRSRVVVPIGDAAIRQPRVAVQVHASVGRVVAAQTLRFDTASGPPGVASTLGALAPAGTWWFADGQVRAGGSQLVAISNVGPIDAHVSVQGLLDSRAVVAPVVLTVPSGGVSWVAIGGCAARSTQCLRVPDDARFGLKVQADAGAPIVAQLLGRFPPAGNTRGALTSMGATAPAAEWVFTRSWVAAEWSTSVAIVNPAAATAHLTVALVHGGSRDRPAALARVSVGSGQLVLLPHRAYSLSPRADAALVVTSDTPVYAESTIYAERDASRAPAVLGR